MKKILIIVPTRNRNIKSKEFAQDFFINSDISDLLFGLDDDDQQNYERISGVLYDINPRMRLNGTLNFLAKKYSTNYEYISFMGDDHRIRTKNWDSIIYDQIKDINFSIAYGNDLIQKEKLPTAVIMDSKIIQRLSYMSPPSLTHLFLDNFWKDLGIRLQTLKYFPKVIIEHMHYSNGKSDKDSMYEEVNSKEMFKKDRTAYEIYLKNNFENDVSKII
jgi:hypothetical protein